MAYLWDLQFESMRVSILLKGLSASGTWPTDYHLFFTAPARFSYLVNTRRCKIELLLCTSNNNSNATTTCALAAFVKKINTS
jgi:hypothetical protein